MIDDTQQTARPGGDPKGPGLFHTVRQVWGTRTGRRAIALGVGLLIASVGIVVGLVLFSSMSRESQSYRDGYSIGGAVYASDASAQADAQQACKQAELKGPEKGGLPVGDDRTKWLGGCVAAFAAAQSGN